MLRVALTGGVCSGKSAAAAIFRQLGCFVSQSDEIARSMMQPGECVFAGIVQAFGSSVVLPDGTLDRAALARIAFGEGRVEELNAIVHPAVIDRQAAWMREIAASHPDAVAMVESALVFETRHGETRHGETSASQAEHDGPTVAPWRSRFDRIVLVTAPQQQRVERYFARVHASSTRERAEAEADVRARMAAQMSDEEKAKLADFVMENVGSLDDLHRNVERVWRQLRTEASDAAAEAM